MQLLNITVQLLNIAVQLENNCTSTNAKYTGYAIKQFIKTPYNNSTVCTEKLLPSTRELDLLLYLLRCICVAMDMLVLGF